MWRRFLAQRVPISLKFLSILGKLFDLIIQMSHRYALNTNDTQFGLKSNHFTTQCTFVADEVVQYYVNNGSNVPMMQLDASQAFDHVNCVKLFNLSRDRGMCPLKCRFIAYT